MSAARRYSRFSLMRTHSHISLVADNKALEPYSDQLNIKLRDTNDYQIYFKIKKTCELGKLLKAWADQMGRAEDSLRLVYDGQRVCASDTCESVSD